MTELGMHQEYPTVIYQDNKSTIQIANHRGSLGKTSHAMDLEILATRNRIEGHQSLMISSLPSLRLHVLKCCSSTILCPCSSPKPLSRLSPISYMMPASITSLGLLVSLSCSQPAGAKLSLTLAVCLW
jgi:hypothetical protein